GQYGPYGPQSVYAMFIPWQADEGTRQDAITEAKRAKSEGGASRYVVVDPLGDGQYEV
ncbi:MAG: histone deacetylase, partial [Veillonella sp.]|nr:histone deacetylase [Veillonella sp.]